LRTDHVTSRTAAAAATSPRGLRLDGLNPSARRRVASNQAQPDPMLPITDVVHQKAGRSMNVADDNINVAVVVDVAERDTAAYLRQSEDFAGLRADVLEATVSQIPK